MKYLLIVFSIGLSACSSSHYIYVQESVVGVDVGISGSGNERLTLGYTVDTFVIIPEVDDNEAASSIAVINGKVKGISCFKFKQFNVTGIAAENLATKIAAKPDVIKDLREHIYGQKDPRGASEC
jgi:hypothetical protein